AATGVWLEADSILFQSVDAAQIFKNTCVRFTAVVVGIEETVSGLQRLRIGCEPGFRQAGGEHTISRCESDVQRFGHRAEIRADSAGHRSRYPERHFHFGPLQTEQAPPCCPAAPRPALPLP